MFEAWAGLPWWLRLCVALLFLSIALLLYFYGRFYLRILGTCLGIGIVLLMFSFPSDNERKGYHDL